MGAYKIQEMIHRNPNFFGDQGHLKFLQLKYLRGTNGPCQIDVLISMAVTQQHWVQHRAC